MTSYIVKLTHNEINPFHDVAFHFSIPPFLREFNKSNSLLIHELFTLTLQKSRVLQVRGVTMVKP